MTSPSSSAKLLCSSFFPIFSLTLHLSSSHSTQIKFSPLLISFYLLLPPRPCPPCVRCVCTFAAIMNNEYLFCLRLIFGRFWNVLHDFFFCCFVFSFLFVCVLDSDECSFILICSVCGKKRHCNPVLQHRNTPLPIVYFSPPIPTPPPPPPRPLLRARQRSVW